MRKMNKFRGLGVLIFLAVFAAATAVVMLLWNSVATFLFDVPEINFWYSAGLIILSKLLLGGFRLGWGHHGHCHGHHGGFGKGARENGKCGGDWDENARDLHDRFHKMSHAERKEHIRRHMASLCHNDRDNGPAREGEETKSGDRNDV